MMEFFALYIQWEFISSMDVVETDYESALEIPLNVLREQLMLVKT